MFRLLSKQNRLTMTRNAVWALSNLCRGKNPPPEFAKVRNVKNLKKSRDLRGAEMVSMNEDERKGL